MSTFTDLEKDAASVDGFVNENGLIPTRRNGPKPSYQYLVDEMRKSRGFRVVGTFADGFTYELFNDVGIDTDGNSWIYVGDGAPNKVVDAGTVPSVSAGYEQVTFNAASGVLDSRGTNVQDYIDGNLTPFKTVADMKAAAYLLTLPEFTRIEWQGYYAQSDGGSNWGVLRFGSHTEILGKIFSIDANTYIEANFASSCKINIRKFGASPSLSAIDNNSKINRAMDEAESLKTLIYVPDGRFETGQHKGRSDSGICGSGRGSVLIRNRGLSDFGSLLFLEGGSDNPDDNIKNYTIKDVTIEGTVEIDGFSEFKHLVLAQGVSNLNIRRVYFKGWQGDALVIRSGNNAFKNDTVRVKSCEFDGINKNNRNAISINDCVGLWITSNKFLNCVRDGDPNYAIGDPFDVMDQASGRGQPGAIDIEPNTQDTYVRVRNIRIRNNEFENIGGNVGCVMMFLPIPWQDMDEYPNDIEVSGNHLRNVYRAFYFTELQNADIDETAPPINLKILNNNVQAVRENSFWIYGLRGVRMEGNFYRDVERAGLIGWSQANRGTYDVRLKGETFRFCGKTDGVAVKIYNSEKTRVSANFEECGVEAGGFGIPIEVAGVASKVELIENKITNITGRSNAAVSVSGTLVKGGNSSIRNDWDGLGTSSFTPDLTEFGESTVNESVTANTTLGQANATQLFDALNIVTTSNSTNSGVKLPPAKNDGRIVTVRNEGVAPCALYPSSGDDLGQGTNVFEQIPIDTVVSYKSYSASDWIKL